MDLFFNLRPNLENQAYTWVNWSRGWEINWSWWVPPKSTHLDCLTRCTLILLLSQSRLKLLIAKFRFWPNDGQRSYSSAHGNTGCILCNVTMLGINKGLLKQYIRTPEPKQVITIITTSTSCYYLKRENYQCYNRKDIKYLAQYCFKVGPTS